MSTDFDVPKFLKLMMMTTSSFDEEALVAMRKANAMLAAKNMNWQEFLAALSNDSFQGQQVQTDPNKKAKVYDPDLVEPMFEVLTKNRSRISRGGKAFIDDVYSFWCETGFLTIKQFEAIKANYERFVPTQCP